MTDAIETIGRSQVQHGFGNDRVYLMKLAQDEAPEIVDALDQLVRARGYSKIFAKIPARVAGLFVTAGYRMEAAIPGFFPDGGSAYFMAKYFSEERSREHQPQLVQDVLAAAGARRPVATPSPLPAGFAARLAVEADAVQMAALYREVFASYPFPIGDPAFLRESMRGSTVYFGVWHGEKMVALSSSEIDYGSGSAEMTDFATLPDFRGHGLALNLLQQMEGAMQASGINSLFTIARAYSFGMNVTFARSGYRFGGTLTNNTNIFGSLESMNVWHKAAEASDEPCPEVVRAATTGGHRELPVRP